MEDTPTLEMRARKSKRTRILSILGVIFLAVFVAWLGWWFFVLRHLESTDDSYVAGNLVTVSPQVAGSVVAIHVDDVQAVKAGDALVELDPTDADLALSRARTTLAEAVRQVRSLMAESGSLDALVKQRQVELEKAEGDYARRLKTQTSFAVSREEFIHARDAVAVAKAALLVAEQRLKANHVLLQDTPLEQQPSVVHRAEELREAWLARLRCTIKSPVDGFVAQRTVQVGARVVPGTPLMAIVPLHNVWVNANFKEVQLARMRAGQPAKVVSDLYGRSVEFHGRVVGLAAGTGSAFSLLPPENATGNWIKIVQRVPVKVELDPEELKAHPLRVGLSCTVTVDVRGGGGEVLASVAGPVYSTDVLSQDMRQAEEEIWKIIQANAAPHE